MNKNITCSVALFVVHCLLSIVCLRKYRNCHHHTDFLTYLFQYCLLRRIHASRPLQNVWVVIRWVIACAALTLKVNVLRKKCSGCAAFTTFSSVSAELEPPAEWSYIEECFSNTEVSHLSKLEHMLTNTTCIVSQNLHVQTNLLWKHKDKFNVSVEMTL